MAAPFFTIGHSNRSLAEFVALLEVPRVERIIDVRKMPRSRTNPQFNGDVLAEGLAPAGIAYEHLAALGGLRGKARSLAPEVNGFWTNESFHNYADYALTAEFRAGLERLLDEGRRARSAIMCSEAVWWRCHRRIVADYLLARGEEVFHIMGPGRLEPARLTPGAVVGADGTVTYPG
jgi:uncharacterized protein (DUF488 family)